MKPSIHLRLSGGTFKLNKMEFRKLFPITWYRLKTGQDWNPFLFWVDCMFYVIPLTIISALILNSLGLIG
jgi:hypothetical protein